MRVEPVDRHFDALSNLTAILATVSWPLWACLLVVLTSPVTVIVAYELFEWRSLTERLDNATGAAAPDQ